MKIGDPGSQEAQVHLPGEEVPYHILLGCRDRALGTRYFCQDRLGQGIEFVRTEIG